MSAEAEILQTLKEDITQNRLTLPTLPEVALRVKDVVEDENASAGDVAKVISTDAALTARLIQVANSPAYRGTNQVENVQVAVARLGQQVVRNLATSLAMQQMFQATSDVTDKRMRELWEHNTQVAAISSALATMAGLKPDVAMLAGLVHDIGALPILVRAEEVPELLENEALLDKIIMQVHPILGKLILETWEFAPEVVSVAAEHENLTRQSPGEGPDYVDVVQVANLQSYIGGHHPHAGIDLSSVPAFAKLGIDPEISVIDMEGMAEEIAEVQESLSG